MLLAGIAVHIGCFKKHWENSGAPTPEFSDRLSVFSELAKLSFSTWSFAAEIGLREAFGHPTVLLPAVLGFRQLMLTPRLFTTGIHFTDRQQTINQLEELSDAGVQQIILRVDNQEAAALPSDSVLNLISGCHAGGIDLRLQFELEDSFTEDCCRIARTVEDRQFTVTVLPVRIRPTRSVPLAGVLPLERKQRMQLVLIPTGEVLLRRQTHDEIIDIAAGNALHQPLYSVITQARTLQ